LPICRGGAGQAERQRPMDALSTRGRRNDGRDDWARGSGGVTAPGAVKRRARGLGRRDTARISRARREGFQTGDRLGSTRQWRRAQTEEGDIFVTAKLSQKLNYGQELVNTKVVEDGPNYNFLIGTFL